MIVDLRPEGLDFLETAPESYVFEARLAAPRQRVWDAISADPSTWTWFPGLARARYLDEAPHGVGSGREVHMAGTYYRETMIAWDEPGRWAYRVDASSAPIARAIVEDWRVLDAPAPGTAGATTVRWTFAIDPTPLFRAGQVAASHVMGTLYRKAMRNLDAHLAATTATTPTGATGATEAR